MANPEELARGHGFKSYAELLDASEPLPMMPGDVMQSYIARSPRGLWFVWDEIAKPSDTPNGPQ
ncbi:MAG: hypothetical protein HY290_25955 [Planctomycetia bacterium]|nr:hypothetical protein [Planctomycetia bacterium]